MIDKVFRSLLRESKTVKTLNDLMLLVRNNIQFNDSPGYLGMQNGEMDCVGVSFLLKKLISTIFRDVHSEVVALPSLPWLGNNTSLSKHTGVVVFYPEGLIIIDATPISGYGYGKVSKLLPYNLWRVKNKEWFLKQLNFNSELMWDNIIYNHFKVIKTKDIKTIFYINEIRSQYNSNNLKTFNEIDLTSHIAWNKEYWRLMGKVALRNKNKSSALEYLKKAFQTDCNDPYVLAELANLLKGNEKARVLNLHSRVMENLCHEHGKVVYLWNKRVEDLYVQRKWKEYLRYIGMIYWREKSISYYAGSFPVQIDHVNYKGYQIPLYNFTPAWFKKNNVGVLIKNSKDLFGFHGYRTGQINKKHTSIYEEVFEIKNISEQISMCLIDRNSNALELGECFTFNPIQSHYWYLGILNPELLLI